MKTIKYYILPLVALFLTTLPFSPFKEAGGLLMAQSNQHFIKSCGTNWINTGYTPNSNTKVIITFNFWDSPLYSSTGKGNALFGSGDSTTSDAGSFWLLEDKDALGNTHLKYKMGTCYQVLTWPLSYTTDDASQQRYRITLQNGSLILEESSNSGQTWSVYKSCNWKADPVFQATTKMFIGGINGSSGVWGNEKSDIRVYEVIIEENNQIKHHFYPASRENDSNSYLYDKTTNTVDYSYNFSGGYNVAQDKCSHLFVTYNNNGNFKCRLCGKSDVKMNEWAKNHENARGITAVDPYLDVTSLTVDSCVQQTLVLSGTSNISDTYIVDSATNVVLVSKTNSSDASKQLSLPNCDKERTLYACGYVRTADTYNDGNDNISDSLYVFSAVKFTEKPFHQPHDLTVTQQPGIKKDGTCSPYNEITWRIQDPTEKGSNESNDLMAEDEFMVYRAFSSDYSDEEVLDDGTASLSEFTKGEDGYGYFTVKDDSEESQYNTNRTQVTGEKSKVLTDFLSNKELTSVEKLAIEEFYKSLTPVYYRVTRALVSGIWGDAAKNFSLKKTLTLHNMLPPVSSIKVQKTTNWSNDKKVVLHLTLENPYVWQFNSLMDTAKIHRITPDTLRYRRYTWDTNTNIKVKRFSPESDYDTTHSPATDAAAETITIKGSEVKWDEKAGCYTATVEDLQSLPYTHYYYTAELDTTNSIYPTAGAVIPYTTTDDEANECYSETVASVGDLTATQGNANGEVNLTWTLGLATSNLGGSQLQLVRREYKGLNETTNKVEYGEEKVFTLDNTSNGYIDKDVLPGHVYEYNLVSIFTYRGKPYTTEAKTLGWPSHVGTIAGKVLLPNGTAVRGATVRITSKSTIDIADVKDEFGKIIVPGVHTGLTTEAKQASANNDFNTTADSVPVTKYEYSYLKEIVTNENGEFSTTVDFCADGTLYSVSVAYGGCTFTWNGNSPAQLTLDSNRWEYTNINMVSNVSYQFSGNVLYENSTIPVRNAMFELIHYDSNGNITQREYLRDRNGDYIKSDQMGAFSVSLLPIKCSLRVVKNGHTMSDDGLLKVGDKLETIFTPQKGQQSIRIWDKTKVRMIGRVVGGNIQGNKPIGKGLSRNNLGDSLTVVMQLEGDNTSKIVYQQNDPDNTTIKDTIKHNIDGANYKTTVTFERKRIVIKPDLTTGEFFVDLAPARYKVSQISAEGYATLYQDGQGFDVLDYVDSIGTVYYNHVYHIPATVTYTQYTYGRQTAYIGEKSLKKKNLLNNNVTIEIASEVKDAKSNKYSAYYTFDHPVFQSGNKYLLKVQAHEDYYYNNNSKSGVLDMVNLDGGKLHVRNGMVKDNSDSTYVLNSDGSTLIYVSADTPDFTNTGEKALRDISMQVEYKDYFYDAKSLQAYVLGEKYMGADIVPVGSKLNVVDIIRDPYGSQSYAYREAGSTYHWESDKFSSWQCDFDISGSFGTGFKNTIGFGLCTIWEFSATLAYNMSIPLKTNSTKNNKGYDMTLNERISTSSDPLDVGANADVFIGTEETYAATEVEAVSIIDQTTYDIVKSSIDNGTTKIITEGKSTSGDKYYVARGIEYGFGTSKLSTFAYSQKHILGTIIPNLEKKYKDLLSDGDTTVLQNAANADGTPRYWYDESKDKVIMLRPKGSDKTFSNMADSIYNAIQQWEKIVAENEGRKLDIMGNNPYKSYSVATTEVGYSEEASGYSQSFAFNPDRKVTGGFSLGGGNKDTGKEQEVVPSVDNKGNVTGKERGETSDRAVGASFPGVNVSLTIGPKFTTSSSSNREYYQIKSAGYGFVLKGNDNGYMNMDVYRDSTGTDISIPTDAQSAVAADLNVGKDEAGQALKDDTSEDVSGLHNFIFVLRGGATRQPWYAADTTVYCKTGSLLGTSTLKIDNPKIYIASPVISNQPEDESATFQLQLTNESEYTGNNAYLNPSTFVLLADETTNPYGAQLYMDGTPLGNGRNFTISPGQSIVKTLEVKKGVGYKFDDIKLIFRDAANSLIEKAAISVNYLPMASKVTVTSPTDKWVMNTLSSSDENGYYIPVSLGDFNVNSEGFHHIELQYKKQTDGDSQWVTFDSFYNDSTIMNTATGTKHMIDNGKIANVKFHGEKDPIEMKYDLRAVAFRELGTGFTTRSSSVMSGTKDTRRPEIFGLPAPASGILTYQDVVQMNFTEPIAYNYLDKVSDFSVRGYTNESDISLTSSLQFNGSEDQVATTTVDRTISYQDFTIDMLVKVDDKDDVNILFSHGDENHNMAFGTFDNYLYSYMDGSYSFSICLDSCGIDISSDLTHVGMAYNHETGEVKFFAGSTYIKGVSNATPTPYSASGKIFLGRNIDDFAASTSVLHGNMLEVRLWGKVLSEDMIAAYNKKRLSGYENQLIAHWPMTEASGRVVKDDAHGANLNLIGNIDWKNVDGYSLFTSNNSVGLNPDLITCSAEQDYSLTFWFKVDSLKTDKAALFSAGSKSAAAVGAGRLFVGFDKTDMVITSNGISYKIGKTSDYANNIWHHFAMTVNRGRNMFVAYLDGNVALEAKADSIDGISSSSVALGDEGIYTHFDVFSRWEQSLPKYIIQNGYNTRFSGQEMGLKAYLPFYTRLQSDQGVMYNSRCVLNRTMSKDENGTWKYSTVPMVTTGYDPNLNLDINNHAPIREMPELENLDFSWSSTGSALQININRPNKDINKQPVYITVRGIEDQYGNVMKSPQSMVFYVDKNVLVWDDQTLNIECKEGESHTVSEIWKNVSGKRVSYSITGLPSWLHVDNELGTVEPEQDKFISLTTDAELAPGKYTTVLYLNDEDSLADPLTINLTVKPTDSGWKVDKTRYDRTMNIRAVVKTMNCNKHLVLDADENDVVGAFIANECIGVSNIAEDGYLYMTIYGDTAFAQKKRNVQFRLWNHETGLISELLYMLPDSTYSDIQFMTNSTVGLPPNDAILLVTSDKKVQNINLTKGWNWVSFYLQPSALEGVNSVFINSKDLFSDGDIIKHVDFAQYSEKTRDWMGYLSSTDYHNVYQIYVEKAGSYRIMGKSLSEDELMVPIKAGWNDVPYLLTASTTIDNALADYLINDKAHTGDIIKSMDQFAVADGRNGKIEWVGTLKYMQPGKGYYLYHTGQETSFKYQTNVISVSYAKALNGSELNNTTEETGASSTLADAYSKAAAIADANMPVIATLADSTDTQEGDTIIAIADNKVVGASKAAGTMYISVNAANGNAVTFGLVRGGEVINTTSKPVTYAADAIVGSLDSPHVIDFSESEGTASVSGDLYDLGGRKMNVKAAQPKGVYINGNGKKMVK